MSARRLDLAALLVFAATAAFHASYAYHGIALFDEGVLADGTCRVLAGEALGRDAFVPYGPGSFWLLAPCFALFGKSLVTLRTVTVVLQALADAALFRIAAARSTPLGALLGAGLLAIAHGSLHKSFLLLAVLLVLAGAHLVARPERDAFFGRVGAAFVAGVMVGFAFLLRHDVGAFGAVALPAGILVSAEPGGRLRRQFALAGGFMAVVGPACLVLLVAGLEPRTWWDHEWQRIAVQERIPAQFPWPWEAEELKAGQLTLLVAMLGVPIVHLAWGGAALRRALLRRPLDGDAMRVAVALFGLLLLNQARLIPSPNHLFQSFAPVALALADLVRPAPAGEGRLRPILKHGALAAVVAGLLVWVANAREGPYSGSFRQRVRGGVELDLPAAGVVLEPAEAQTLRSLVAAVQERTRPGEGIMTSPGCPLVAFLAERPLVLPADPAYWYRAGPDLTDERFERAAIAQLERARTSIWVHDPRPAANHRFEDEAPLVLQWLLDRFRPVETIDRFVVYQRVR